MKKTLFLLLITFAITQLKAACNNGWVECRKGGQDTDWFKPESQNAPCSGSLACIPGDDFKDRYCANCPAGTLNVYVHCGFASRGFTCNESSAVQVDSGKYQA